MNNLGTKFYKCDFQVHTPRDQQFSGTFCETEEERKIYSKAFISKCRELDLRVVAITDHHDLYFYKYIKEASQVEVDNSGNPVPPEDKIFVFPGMELTLDVPCQAILIFDSTLNLNDELIIQIYTALGINEYTPRLATKTAPTQRLEIKDINEVYERLEKIPVLVGKFILFPNVKDGGTSTILRKGFHKQYANGRFVGGYLDGDTYNKHKVKQGWCNIVNGVTEAYGKREIGIFQTSDCRNEKFSTLGDAFTWLKFSEPTAEGIRQSCLAKKSRIKQEEPKLPSVYIEKLEVLNSTFLRDFSAHLNPQLNVVIGGRGTGKSSLLQYIEYALGKDHVKENDLLEKFINGTLSNGSVKLSLIKNGVKHIIERSKQKYTIIVGDSDPSNITIENISNIIQSDSYSQKELSKHGRNRPNLVNHLIEFSIQEEIYELGRKLKENENKIQERAVRLLTLFSDRVELKDLMNQETSISAQIVEMQKNIEGSENDKKIIEDNSTVIKELAWVEKVSSEFETIKTNLNEFIETNQFEVEIDIEGIPINQTELNNIKGFINDKFKELKEKLSESITLINTKDLNTVKDPILLKHTEHNSKYEEAKSRMIEKQGALNLIEENVKKIGQIRLNVDSFKEKIEANKNLEIQLGRLYFERISLINERFNLVKAEAENLSVVKEGCLEIELLDSFNIQELISDFNAKVTLARGQTDRTDNFFNKLRANNPINLHKVIIKFWYALFKVKIDKDLEIDSVLSEYGIQNDDLTKNDLDRILNSLTIQDIIRFSLISPSSNVGMWYYKDSSTKIEFENASDGQQAGAILNILLNQTHGPLLIDQPEDDIDNKVIHQITERINSTKQNRQLIFVSHNANVAVNGDAELIIQFDHNANKSAGEIRNIGAIDSENIKSAVKDIMEGGEDALKLRFSKYGF